MYQDTKLVLFDVGECVFTRYEYQELGLYLNKEINPESFEKWMIKNIHCKEVDLMKNGTNYIVNLFKKYTKTERLDEEIIKAYINYRGYVKRDVLYTFSYLNNLGIKTGILSNCDIILAEENRKLKKNLGFEYFFQSSEIGLSKPFKPIYLMVEVVTGFKGKEITFVDNLEKNLIEPKNLGWNTIRYSSLESENMLENFIQ